MLTHFQQSVIKSQQSKRGTYVNETFSYDGVMSADRMFDCFLMSSEVTAPVSVRVFKCFRFKFAIY